MLTMHFCVPALCKLWKSRSAYMCRFPTNQVMITLRNSDLTVTKKLQRRAALLRGTLFDWWGSVKGFPCDFLVNLVFIKRLRAEDEPSWVGKMQMHASEAMHTVVTRCYKGLVQVNTPELSVASFTNLQSKGEVRRVSVCVGTTTVLWWQPSATNSCWCGYHLSVTAHTQIRLRFVFHLRVV